MIRLRAGSRGQSRFELGPTLRTVLALGVATLLGLAIGMLPLPISAALAGAILALLALLIAAVAPTMRTFPAKRLAWGLTIAIAFYFVWPRNVFLPVPGLPVKHPQRLYYLLFLVYALYVLAKCAPARNQLAGGLKALPWLTAMWAGLAVWQLLSLALAQQPGTLFGGWFVELLVVTALYPLALLCLPSVRDHERLWGALLIAALVNCFYAITETFLQRNLFERFVSLESLDPVIAQQIIAAKVRGGQYRAQGSFDHPLLLAEYLAVTLPFAIAMLFMPRRRTLGALALLLLVLGLYLSHSRVAIVASIFAVAALVVGMIARGASRGRRNPWPLVGALFALPLASAAAVFASPFVKSIAVGSTAIEASSTDARWAMLRGGLQLISEAPIVGYGPGSAGSVLNFRNTAGVMTLDNYLLALTLDAGLPALFLYLAILIGAAWRALGLCVRAEAQDAYRLAWALFGALLAFSPIKLVLGTGLNNLLLPLMVAAVAIIAASHRRNPSAYAVAPLHG